MDLIKGNIILVCHNKSDESTKYTSHFLCYCLKFQMTVGTCDLNDYIYCFSKNGNLILNIVCIIRCNIYIENR